MPLVVFLKYLRITALGSDRQGKFEYAECTEVKKELCPHCRGTELYVHGYYRHMIHAKGRDGARKRLRLKIKRYKCRCCGKSFSQNCDHIGFMKWQRRNESLNEAITQECANGVSNKKIAEKYRMSESTVERRLHCNHRRLLREQLDYPCPQMPGIDAHSIHRGGCKRHKFAETPADLRHHRVYEVFEGKSSKVLEANLQRLKGRNKVKVVCMDLSSPFHSLIMRLFPNAKIVADRFHVIRPLLETFHEFCKAADPEIKRKRGITVALRTKGANLRDEQKLLPEKEFGKHPAIRTA